ncbi:MAG TPA: hypothetical protein VH877_26860 [Polyangia bacterium]|jgi:hypothetical protein|nr:hypothetical protein [Polyangia bacterium]
MRNLALYLLSAAALLAAAPGSTGGGLSLAPTLPCAAFDVAQGDDLTAPSSLSSAEASSEDDDDTSGACETAAPFIPRPDEVRGWQTRSDDVPSLLQITRDCFKNRGPPVT